jgi:transposase InsO family protein
MNAHEDQFPKEAMSTALEVSRSGYYKARHRPQGVRRRQDERLREEIGRIHKESRGNYGSPRVHLQLGEEGIRCGRKRVARLMREADLKGVCRRRRKARTTDSNHAHQASPNLIGAMKIGRPNEVWVTDITYLRTAADGWVYLAAVLDLYSRKIVGWSVGRTLDAGLVIRALNQALATRDWRPGLIVHSDRGIQYACTAFRRLLARHGLRQSMSAKGNCYDNATMESFFGTFKAEQGEVFPDAHSARLAVFDYIETFYNRHRIHTSLEGCSPAEFERRHHSGAPLATRTAASDEFFGGMGCSAGGRGSDSEPESHSDSPDSHDRLSHHPDYPSEGCSPAEPSSVSPGRGQQHPHSGIAQHKNTE